MMHQTDRRPLSHLRVLDFGQYLAGPLVGMMLADMGAEVIRIDPPGGPRFKSPAFDMLSRGKRSLSLDAKTQEGRQTILELCRRCDVVIENFRPGVMARLGLGPEDLHAVNPAIISLSMPGFASTDPELAGVAAWEAVIAARTGQFTDMGLNRRLMGINPSFTPLPLASAYGASFGAMAVLFALAARRNNGGEHIEVPLASALLEGLVYNCQQIEDYPDRYKSPREHVIDQRQASGLPMNLAFKELSEFLDPFYRTYTCADGRGFYVVACSVAGHPQRALETLGLGDLARSLPDFDAYLDRGDWPDPWSLRNYPVGTADRARVSSAMKAAFATRPSQKWEALFGAAKAPGTAQRHTSEWLTDPHALASGLVLEVDDPRHGTMRQMGNVAWLADDAMARSKRPGPVGDDAREGLAAILAEPGREAPGNSGAGGWLDGLKVLDLTNVIAGPTIGSTLARFGAEVTLVQPARPSVDPWNAVVFGMHAQRGKESILLDLGTEQGREVLDRLIAESDVVTMNGTDEQRDRLGLSAERLEAFNPRLILVQLDAFGGPGRGPKSDHLGYDDLAQAATGVMLRFGGGMDTPEEHAHFGTIDVLTGIVPAWRSVPRWSGGTGRGAAALPGPLWPRRAISFRHRSCMTMRAANHLMNRPAAKCWVGGRSTIATRPPMAGCSLPPPARNAPRCVRSTIWPILRSCPRKSWRMRCAGASRPDRSITGRAYLRAPRARWSAWHRFTRRVTRRSNARATGRSTSGKIRSGSFATTAIRWGGGLTWWPRTPCVRPAQPSPFPGRCPNMARIPAKSSAAWDIPTRMWRR